MGNKVFPVLKFSYDNLPCERDRNCFLFFSLFLEDYNIRKDELINLWIGEGLLDGYCRNMHDAFNLGEFIVGTLKLACLLESDESEEFIRMHDMIHEMALWVANTSGRERNKILVQHLGSSTEADWFEKRYEAEMISVWGHHNSIESFTGEPLCPNLLTLLVKDTMLKTVSNEILQSMHALKVLDVSGNRGLTKLPKSIGELINLQYLNLSETANNGAAIRAQETKKIENFATKLYKASEKKIPTKVISSLSCLQVFSMVTDEFSPSQTALYAEQALLLELERLEELGDLQITIRSASGAFTILESPMLQKCTKKLSFSNVWDLNCLKVSYSSIERMNLLLKLEIMFCKSLKELEILNDTGISGHHCFQSLHEVVIRGCEFSNATWLVYAPRLQKLTVADCVMKTRIKDNLPNERIEIVSTLTREHLPWNLTLSCSDRDPRRPMPVTSKAPIEC